ncbi:MAG: hypothetical protein IPK39_09860 [Sulfuritalea sp.]|nr:hypothetical protein [Sulfuritalea sp.]
MNQGLRPAQLGYTGGDEEFAIADFPDELFTQCGGDDGSAVREAGSGSHGKLLKVDWLWQSGIIRLKMPINGE